MPNMLVHAAAKPSSAGVAPQSDAALTSALQQARTQVSQPYGRVRAVNAAR